MRRSRLWQAFIGLLILVAALGVFAWQQGGDGDGPLNAIAAAAEKTQDQSGGRAVMHSVVTTAGQSAPLTMTGRIVFNAEDRARGVITAPQTASGGPMTLDIVGDGTVMYMHSSQFDSLPDGRKWMALDLSLGDELNTSVPADVDAKGELALLESVSGDIQKLGKEDVRGVPTPHYRGTIAVSDQVKRMREEGADAVASLTEKDGSPLQVEAWIDADGLVRRMSLVHSQPAEEGRKATTIDMRIDFFDFGFEPEIDVPDSSEVFDATALTRSKLGLSDDE
jgi:hypothetical protein